MDTIPCKPLPPNEAVSRLDTRGAVNGDAAREFPYEDRTSHSSRADHFDIPEVCGWLLSVPIGPRPCERELYQLRTVHWVVQDLHSSTQRQPPARRRLAIHVAAKPAQSQGDV
jgi:hypothetical protein